MKLIPALLLPVLASCGGDDGAPPPPPRESVTVHRTLIGNELSEARLIGGPADRAIIHLTVSGDSITWNLHAHVDLDTITIDHGSGGDPIEVDFVPPQAETWNLSLRNTSAVDPVTVDGSVDLYGAMAWTDLN